jgi:hypothetical protein
LSQPDEKQTRIESLEQFKAIWGLKNRDLALLLQVSKGHVDKLTAENVAVPLTDRQLEHLNYINLIWLGWLQQDQLRLQHPELLRHYYAMYQSKMLTIAETDESEV